MDPRTEQMLAARAERAAANPPPPRGAKGVLQEARRWAQTNRHSSKILAGTVVAVFFAGYYLIVTLPAQRADRLENEARAAERLTAHIASKQVEKSDCLAKADADAAAQWAAACKARREGPNCALPQDKFDALQKAETAARNACLLVK
jgi:type II secretory pathway component PulM